MKLRKGSKISFSAISDLTGQHYEAEGIIKGGAEEIKKIQPEEFGGLKDSEEVYLVVGLDNFGNTLRCVVFPEEILKQQHPDECDCIECQARVEKGGLDYDPSNDNEEFEEHEKQVFRDVGIDRKK